MKHLELAKKFWDEVLSPGDTAIDMTVGNGHDSLFIANRIVDRDRGELFCFDIQEKAIENSKKLLKESLLPEQFRRVSFLQASHETIDELPVKEVKLIVYNLGYLPRGDKTITTRTESTVGSLKKALSLIKNGFISITAYPGHKEGLEEEKELVTVLSGLDRQKWSVSHHRWINGDRTPSLFWIKDLNGASSSHEEPKIEGELP